METVERLLLETGPFQGKKKEVFNQFDIKEDRDIIPLMLIVAATLDLDGNIRTIPRQFVSWAASVSYWQERIPQRPGL